MITPWLCLCLSAFGWMTQHERNVFVQTNAERARENLPALRPHPILTQVARAHSAMMLQRGELAHELDGKSPAQRVAGAGYRFRAMAENVASGTNLVPKDAMKLWIDSEQHRANIMNGEHTEIGIGIAYSANGDVYYTQVFARPLR